ncbi:unnamed protein product [Dovyalis caffra]|uniref:Uncharacterized protein n=1 Tax=Dovyalis caffra TaxID=77055 RepID=A0AAV1S7V9_9ROSI|nr:unnamed protein product [Dovyalis caffra]
MGKMSSESLESLDSQGGMAHGTALVRSLKKKWIQIVQSTGEGCLPAIEALFLQQPNNRSAIGSRTVLLQSPQGGWHA